MAKIRIFELANGSPYGLGGSIITKDIERGKRMPVRSTPVWPSSTKRVGRLRTFRSAGQEFRASRFLLTCKALSSTREKYAFTVFERLLKERGLPANIRSDNGVPFASAHALFNLAVWWLRLAIGIELTRPRGLPK